MSFRKGRLYCNYCKEVIREVPKEDWWIYADNTQVYWCQGCKDKEKI